MNKRISISQMLNQSALHTPHGSILTP